MAAGLISLVIGLIGGAAGIYFALCALGFFQYMGGKKSSPSAVDKEKLVSRLLVLNDPKRPSRIVKGEDTDLIAEWKIVDASWYGVFSKSRLKEAYRVFLLLDEAGHSVRCYEEIGSVSWSASTSGLTPSVHYQRSFFCGRVLFRKEYGKGYEIEGTTPFELRKVYDYKFDINEIRCPIVAVVRESGWEWVPVIAKRHATYPKSLPT